MFPAEAVTTDVVFFYDSYYWRQPFFSVFFQLFYFLFQQNNAGSSWSQSIPQCLGLSIGRIIHPNFDCILIALLFHQHSLRDLTVMNYPLIVLWRKANSCLFAGSCIDAHMCMCACVHVCCIQCCFKRLYLNINFHVCACNLVTAHSNMPIIGILELHLDLINLLPKCFEDTLPVCCIHCFHFLVCSEPFKQFPKHIVALQTKPPSSPRNV